MELLKKILKYLMLIVLFFLVIIITFAVFEKYEEYKKKTLELNETTNMVIQNNWKWFDEDRRIQIGKLNDNKSIFRKVYPEKYSIYALKDDNYSLMAMVTFDTKCKPNSEIITTKKFHDGTPKTLTCSKDGDYLRYMVMFDGKSNYGNWSEDLDGFRFNEEFDYWDFTYLDKEVTLSKAK